MLRADTGRQRDHDDSGRYYKGTACDAARHIGRQSKDPTRVDGWLTADPESMGGFMLNLESESESAIGL